MDDEPLTSTSGSGSATAIVAGLVLVAALAIPLWLLTRATKDGDSKVLAREQEKQDRLDAADAKKQAKLERGAGKKKKGALSRMKKGAGAELDGPAAEPAPQAAARRPAADSDSDGDGGEPGTRKEQRKAEKRAERADAREANDANREAVKEREAERDGKRRARDDERAEKERLREEAAAEAKAAKEKAAAEEYEKWKGMFSTEEGGEAGEDAVEDEGLLGRFIEYIKEHKVTVLEELAAEFRLKVKDVITRVQALEQMGYISGVVDDRGKFIYISNAELADVAKYIGRKGRVRISALAQESNRLIDLTPRKLAADAEEEEAGAEEKVAAGR